jgi:hypothetical protein
LRAGLKGSRFFASRLHANCGSIPSFLVYWELESCREKKESCAN